MFATMRRMKCPQMFISSQSIQPAIELWVRLLLPKPPIVPLKLPFIDTLLHASFQGRLILLSVSMAFYRSCLVVLRLYKLATDALAFNYISNTQEFLKSSLYSTMLSYCGNLEPASCSLALKSLFFSVLWNILLMALSCG